jgi:hypothetical protein
MKSFIIYRNVICGREVFLFGSETPLDGYVYY